MYFRTPCLPAGTRWAVGPTLETLYPAKALEMAFGKPEGVEEETLRKLIHHSDRGVQYASREYVALLKDIRLTSLQEVIDAMETAVRFYNTMRPHMSINMMTPEEAAKCNGEIRKWWKSYRKEAIKRGRA